MALCHSQVQRLRIRHAKCLLHTPCALDCLLQCIFNRNVLITSLAGMILFNNLSVLKLDQRLLNR